MIKKLSALFAAILLGLCMAACGAGGKSDGAQTAEREEPEKTMPTISDIDVNVFKTKAIAENDGFTYLFDGDAVAIENGTVRGLVADTVTRVTAKSDYGETTFNVTVHSALTGYGQSESAFVPGGGAYVKESKAYGESFCVLDGKPFDGDGLIATGSILFDRSAQNGEARIILRDSDGIDVYLAVGSTASGYRAYGVGATAEREIGEYNQTRANFLVYVSDGAAYYYLNDKFVWHTQVNDDVRLGFGGKNARTTISRLSMGYNEELVTSLKAQAHKPFGDNIFGITGNDVGAFEDMGDGTYRKASVDYKQQWLYYNADPVCGTNYTVTGTVEMLEPGNSAEMIWQCCNRDGKVMRILLRYDARGYFYICSDYSYNGSFYEYTVRKTNVPNKFDFSYEYRKGTATFRINGGVAATIDSPTNVDIGDLGATHLGFAGLQCRIFLTNISAVIG